MYVIHNFSVRLRKGFKVVLERPTTHFLFCAHKKVFRDRLICGGEGKPKNSPTFLIEKETFLSVFLTFFSFFPLTHLLH